MKCEKKYEKVHIPSFLLQSFVCCHRPSKICKEVKFLSIILKWWWEKFFWRNKQKKNGRPSFIRYVGFIQGWTINFECFCCSLHTHTLCLIWICSFLPSDFWLKFYNVIPFLILFPFFYSFQIFIFESAKKVM